MVAAGVLIAVCIATVGYTAAVGYRKASMTYPNVTSTTDRVKYEEGLQQIIDKLFGHVVFVLAGALLITVCDVGRRHVELMRRML
jgi:hypothetical protein